MSELLDTNSAEASEHPIPDAFDLAEQAIRELTIASNAGDTIDQNKVIDLRAKLGELSIIRAEAALQMSDLGIKH